MFCHWLKGFDSQQITYMIQFLSSVCACAHWRCHQPVNKLQCTSPSYSKPRFFAGEMKSPIFAGDMPIFAGGYLPDMKHSNWNTPINGWYLLEHRHKSTIHRICSIDMFDYRGVDPLNPMSLGTPHYWLYIYIWICVCIYIYMCIYMCIYIYI